MNAHAFRLAGAELLALPSGGLFWPQEGLLCVSDLHLGKSERVARRRGLMLPPYETRATLARLEADIAATRAGRIVCLGDSFDDLAAGAALDEGDAQWLTRLMAGRDWTWIEGNHDPGPLSLGGTHLAEARVGPLTFRHTASTGAQGEVSGHYHPKCSLAGQSRPAFLCDARRLILPAYGAYTGGLRCTDAVLQALFDDPAIAILTGPRALPVPLPRATRRSA
ncbi:Putative metallo-phosphoesterase [Oceanicola granulosus HTCC2516]|uniref:Putative metallo-phosphoesterase n=1 Tax=Oceanicola granulosus (strain ATCC BAA-861 / DSM 15982 / KCTC 12143 / HTCC2516) TaxID=314256 RepID=Q2CID2_OCEGH|nr:ligase-associated DNA damage response endonuclease PdeM [Oceanicola granulosus]EAR52326.1 Putative metallo-phosphoesterase [Oceanicola granulosus HTCC2516]